jgi:uncharacterized repeat protein (TIGR03803 family)
VSGGSGYYVGTIFSLNADGTGFTNLHVFTNGSDGSAPFAGLIISGKMLYGTAAHGGGTTGSGTVFKININGTGFTNLHSFTGSLGGSVAGGNPYAALAISGNTLYGTTTGYGNPFHGTIFSVNTDGTGFTNLHLFTAGTGSYTYITNGDGAFPKAGLNISGTSLYGNAPYGGSSGNGTVFSLSLSPQLAITASGTNVILTWPTNLAGFDYSGFTLQSATNLPSTNWSNVFPLPVVINGQFTVTNAISGAQMFYRLTQ